MSGLKSAAITGSRTIRETWAQYHRDTRNALPPNTESRTELFQTHRRELRTLRQKDVPPPLLVRGDTFAGFTIERRLGAGGMGVVYEAYSNIFGRAALKISCRDMTEEAFNTALLSGLRYKNLVGFVDSGSVEIDRFGETISVNYLATNLIEGLTLKKILSGGVLPQGRAVQIGRSTAHTAEVMHRAGLVHGDIKPANIIITNEEEAVLFDFGLSQRHPVPPRTDGKIRGTPFYMSPEQLRGLSFGPPTDVFALGVSLLEMLTGRPDPEIERARYLELIANGYAPLPPLPYWYPTGLQDILNKATARNPEERYPDGQALAHALEQIQIT